MLNAYLLAPLAGGFLAFDNAETWVLVAFLLFVLLLYLVRVHEIIGNALDNRANNIRKQLDEARQLREEAQTKLADWQRKQQEVQALAVDIVENAKKEAERSAEEAKRTIENTVAQRLRAAEEQIALAEADAVRAVRNASVDAAVAATADLMKQKMGPSDASSMLDRAIDEVGGRLN
ncbi:MAG: ATP F0F1 synthase subunit B [Rhodobacteraceae bacterium]|nr:ATP F0F1 synthase subunit B [Paracoccaceae bacterium]